MSAPHTTWTSGPAAPLRVPVGAPGASDVLTPARLFTVREVASACQLSEKAIRRAIDDGELVAIKLRSRLRVTPDDLQVWINDQRREVSRRPPRLMSRRKAQPRQGAFRALVADREEGERR